MPVPSLMTEDDLKEFCNEYVNNHPKLIEALETAKKMGNVLDAAFGLIETDPHQWSDRPCQTCAAVTKLIGRNFGCYNPKVRSR